MPSDNVQRATVAALSALRAGQSLSVASRWFWDQYGISDISTRKDVLGLAKKLGKASQTIESGEFSGSLGDVFQSVGIPTTDDQGGAFENDRATIWARFSFTEDDGTEVFRSFSVKVPWDMSLYDLDVIMAEFVEDTEDTYGISGGMVVSTSFVIY